MFDSINTECISSPEQSPASRLKGLRLQLGLSRKKFQEATGLSSNTLQAWELGKNHITEKGAVKLSLALDQMGIVCSVEWLLTGRGIPPRTQHSSQTQDSFDEEAKILKEVAFFEANNESSIVLIVTDDSMLPFYSEGDYVAGCQYPADQADMFIGKNCIVTLYSGNILVRRLNKDVNGCYNLHSLNPDTQAENSYLKDCKIQRIAQIVWHRTVDKSSVES